MIGYETKNIAKEDPSQIKKANTFCEEYKKFLGEVKTEREAVDYVIKLAKKNGYKEFDAKKSKLVKGEKYFVNNRGKAAVLFTVGSEPLEKGINFAIAHVDSPRLDLKSNPVYEDSEIAYFKTHYYGGIRKYQWVTMPLSIHGVVFLQNGEKIVLNIGEKETDPQFVITDLLPHLSKKQDEKKLSNGIEGEQLNVVIGSLPFSASKKEEKDVKDAVKEKILHILKDEYKIYEKDFLRAEIEIVPAFKPVDIGFDRSMIGAYGQDDRVCSYPALMAEIECKNPKRTSMAVFTDKEEIGSFGNTGMASEFLMYIVEDLAQIAKCNKRDILKNSYCFSADVNSAYDPNFADVFEKRNASQINHGVVICKVTGSRGKSGASDASCETVAKAMELLDKDKVFYQFSEIGKVDEGGGGTIALYIADKGVDTLDIGVAVLSMHSPFEVVSKLDVYNTYLAYKSLFKR